MSHSFKELENLIPKVRSFNPSISYKTFLKQEILRFYSISGTLKANFSNIETNVDERIFSHILIRSIIENFFRIMYIFDDESKSENRFNEILNGFKKDYAKMYNEPLLPNKNLLEEPDSNWSSLDSPLDIKSMLAKLVNTYGDKLDYLYFMYRITSFDTHGTNLSIFLETAFNKRSNFPVLKLDKLLEIISNFYLYIWNGIESNA